MPFTEEQIRLIFGLKLKQFRNKKELSLFGLAKKTGLSKSYLGEIEKGKKYPKPNKIVLLAAALDAPYDDLVGMALTGKMAPLGDIIISGILKEAPFELFGIEESNLIDIIGNAPEKVTAFIGTLFEIARNYNVTREKFYLAALRSYQESHENYFSELEKEVKLFVNKYHVSTQVKLKIADLEEILIEEFGYNIDYNSLNDADFPSGVRSIYVPKGKRLLISKKISETQIVFILAKELGFCHLQITQRPLTFSLLDFSHFEEVLNNFKASYFAGALIIPETKLVEGLKELFSKATWSADRFHKLLFQFTDSSEIFFQRLTNILPKHFGLRQLFFLRFTHQQGKPNYNLTKELHLSRSHQPHALESKEHYCRRWICTDIIGNKNNYPEKKGIRMGVQYSEYTNTEEKYLILAAGRDDPFNNALSSSVCVGIEMKGTQKKKISFKDDKKITTRLVNVTCERCELTDCKERVAEATIYLEQQQRALTQQKIKEITAA